MASPKCTCAVPCKMHGTLAYRFDTAQRVLRDAINDLRILAGDVVGPSDASWQDVAGTCAVNLRVLARLIEAARLGLVINGPAVFPSPNGDS